MTFKLACGDVMPGCQSHFEATDKGELFSQITRHAAQDHDIVTITPEIGQAVEAHIVRV